MTADAYSSELVLVPMGEIERLQKFLEQAPDVSLADVAYTCAKRYAGAASPVAIAASSVAELRTRLRAVVTRIADGAVRVHDKSGTWWRKTPLVGAAAPQGGKLAFVFPGATSFYPDMLRGAVVAYPRCREAFDELEEALSGGSFSPANFVFPPAPRYRHDADVFSSGGYAQALVAVYSANAALARLLDTLGVRPEGLVGYSGGDLNVLAAAGYFPKFTRERRLAFLREAYREVDTAVNRAGLASCVMAAVVSSRPAETDAVLASLPGDQVAEAFVFSPRQRILAIATEAFGSVQRALAAVGARMMRLGADRPFNTPWCGSILPSLRKFASRWVDAAPIVPAYSCALAAPYPEKIRSVREMAALEWASSVRFGETIRRMYADGYRVFVEVGPRAVATNAIEDILRGEEHAAVALNSAHRADLVQLRQAVGALAALGVPVDARVLFAGRRCHPVDFDTPLVVEVRATHGYPLHRDYPRLALIANDPTFGGAMVPTAGATPAARAKARAAAHDAQTGSHGWTAFPAAPLLVGAETLAQAPGISLEYRKIFSFATEPFLADFALGTSQISYADRSLRGLTLLPLVVGAEAMAELAAQLVPGRHVVEVDDLMARRALIFKEDRLGVRIRAERVASPDPAAAAVKVQLRDDVPDADWTWPAMEATFLLRSEAPAPTALVPPALARATSVHWTERDIYPTRLFTGHTLRGIRRADLWSPTGLDYVVHVPANARVLARVPFPAWALNPLLLAAVTDGFSLWRCHNMGEGSFSFSFRLRHLVLHTGGFTEGQHLSCYLRLTGVTPRSHICDIQASDGNGNLLLECRGFEEVVERLPGDYRSLLLSPATSYLTWSLGADLLGAANTPVASAAISEVPYPIFARNEEIWLKTLSQVTLGATERGEFADMPGSVNRRTEWLFGRIAAKEAVRRFLADNYIGRWGSADVQIWPDDSGKPHALGEWRDNLTPGSSLDIAIAHTAQFVVAVVAANCRVGVDVEALDRDLSEEFVQGVFTEDERALVEGAVNAPSAAVRFWCAKEAVSKALGTGIRYPPKELRVSAFSPDTGVLEVTLFGQWLDAFKQFRGRTISVASTVVKGHVLATCFLSADLFT